MAGCLAPVDAVRDRVPHGGTLYLLDLAVSVDTSRSWNETPVTLGGHCAQAWSDDQGWHLERGALDRAGDAPWLVVDPRYSFGGQDDGHGSSWSTVGDEPEIEGLPFATGPGTTYVRGEGSVPLRPLVVDLAYDDDGTLRLFGDPVTLPHTWNVDDPEGRWSAEMTLRDGPGRHDRWTMYGCD